MVKPCFFILQRSGNALLCHVKAGVFRTSYFQLWRHGHQRNDKLQERNINHIWPPVSNIFVLSPCHILRKASSCAMLQPAKEGAAKSNKWDLLWPIPKYILTPISIGPNLEPMPLRKKAGETKGRKNGMPKPTHLPLEIKVLHTLIFSSPSCHSNRPCPCST